MPNRIVVLNDPVNSIDPWGLLTWDSVTKHAEVWGLAATIAAIWGLDHYTKNPPDGSGGSNNLCLTSERNNLGHLLDSISMGLGSLANDSGDSSDSSQPNITPGGASPNGDDFDDDPKYTKKKLRKKPGKRGEFKGRDALRRENRTARDAARRAGLNRDQQRSLHDAITGQDLNYNEILEIALEIKKGIY